MELMPLELHWLAVGCGRRVPLTQKKEDYYETSHPPGASDEYLCMWVPRNHQSEHQ